MKSFERLQGQVANYIGVTMVVVVIVVVIVVVVGLVVVVVG